MKVSFRFGYWAKDMDLEVIPRCQDSVFLSCCTWKVVSILHFIETNHIEINLYPTVRKPFMQQIKMLETHGWKLL